MSNPFEPENSLVSRAAEKIKRFYPEMEFLEPAERIVAEDPVEQVEENAQIDELETAQADATSRYPRRVRRPRVPYSP